MRQKTNKSIKKESRWIGKGCISQYMMLTRDLYINTLFENAKNGLPHSSLLNLFKNRSWAVFLEQLMPIFIDQFIHTNKQRWYARSSSSEWSSHDTPAHIAFLRAFTQFLLYFCTTVRQLSSDTLDKCHQGLKGKEIWFVQSSQEDMKMHEFYANELEIALMSTLLFKEPRIICEATKAFFENTTK